jgi:hypothetical protein
VRQGPGWRGVAVEGHARASDDQPRLRVAG